SCEGRLIHNGAFDRTSRHRIVHKSLTNRAFLQVFNVPPTDEGIFFVIARSVYTVGDPVIRIFVALAGWQANASEAAASRVNDSAPLIIVRVAVIVAQHWKLDTVNSLKLFEDEPKCH